MHRSVPPLRCAFGVVCSALALLACDDVYDPNARQCRLVEGGSGFVEGGAADAAEGGSGGTPSDAGTDDADAGALDVTPGDGAPPDG